MFGGDSAFNLNYRGYDWNQSAKSVYVYFQIDTNAPVNNAGTSGSVFSPGLLAICGVGGLAVGALVTALSMKTFRRKESKEDIA